MQQQLSGAWRLMLGTVVRLAFVDLDAGIVQLVIFALVAPLH